MASVQCVGAQRGLCSVSQLSNSANFIHISALTAPLPARRHQLSLSPSEAHNLVPPPHHREETMSGEALPLGLQHMLNYSHHPESLLLSTASSSVVLREVREDDRSLPPCSQI